MHLRSAAAVIMANLASAAVACLLRCQKHIVQLVK